MAKRTGLVTLDYIKANFRPAVVEDFVVGAGYARVTKENDQGDDTYAIRGRTIGPDLVREAANFMEGIHSGSIWIVTYYAGGPIGGPIDVG